MSPVVPLSRGKVALVDSEDMPEISEHSWYFHAAGYAARSATAGEHGSVVYMHRQIMDPPQDMEVDHINGDGLDNRRGNLRICTHQQNIAAQGRVQNRERPMSSQYRGVDWCKAAGKWRARIRHQYEQIHIGVFAEEEDAARAYDAKALDLWGEFATLNFPEEVAS